MRAGGPDSPNPPAGASGPGSWGTGGRCNPSPSAGASPPREQGQGEITAGGTEGGPQRDPRMANNRGGEVNFPKDGRGSSRAGQDRRSPTVGSGEASPVKGGQALLQPRLLGAHRRGLGAHPPQEGWGDSQRHPWPS